MRTPTANELLQTIDQQKYHKASTFYLFCCRFIEESEKNGRRFRTPAQGFEAASLKWISMKKNEIQRFRFIMKEERNVVGGNRMHKIRNGSRRDGDYDPTINGLLKDTELRNKRFAENLNRNWNWKFDGKFGVGLERLMVVNAMVPSTASNPGAFTSLAVIEFSLSSGILRESYIIVDHRYGDVDLVRCDAVARVLNLPSMFNRSFGDATPFFFTPMGKLEAVFNSLIYVGDIGEDEASTIDNWSESEKKFSLVTDIADVSVLDRALSTWFNSYTPSGNGDIIEVDDCLEEARICVKRILEKYRLY